MTKSTDTNTNLELIETVEVADVSVIYSQDKAAIDVQIATAQAFPRSIKRCTDDAIAVVTLNKEIAATCTYSVPRGGRSITGPSVHLAKILAQQWGNMRIDSKVVSIDQKHVTSESVCFDLQKNLAIKVSVKKSIIGKTGRFNDDMITVTGNAANSVALRNAVFSVIPKGVVDMVYQAAKQTITGDVSDKSKLIAKRKQVLDGLKETYGVTEKEALGAIGRASIDHITPDDLVILIGIGQAIKDNDTTIELAFKGVKSTNENKVAHKDLKGLFESKKESLSAEDVTHIERILEKKEETSYKKVYDKLKSL